MLCSYIVPSRHKMLNQCPSIRKKLKILISEIIMLDVIAFSLLCVMYVSENDTWSCRYCRRKEWMVSIWMTRSPFLLFVAVHMSVKLWTDYSKILWSLAYDITFFTSNHRIIRG